MNNFKVLIFSILLFTACGNGEEKTPCLYGKPPPIISANTVGVSEYQFSSTANSGTETALLTDSLLKENTIRFSLNQSGCDQMKQVFTFELPPNDYSAQADSFFVRRAAEGLTVLAQKSPIIGRSFMPVLSYQLNIAAADVSLNKRLAVGSELAPNMFFIINKIVTQNEGIITVEFLNE